jgi:excisionase family DNA binding protein
MRRSTEAIEPVRLCLSVEETILALGVKRTRLYELMKEGRLRSFTVGGRRLFRVRDLEAFIAEASGHAA